MRWMQARKWVDFHELWPSVFVASQVKSASIASANGAPGRKSDALRFRDLWVVSRIDERKIATLFALLLINIRIDVLFRVWPQQDFQGADYFGVVAGAQYADSELAARQELLDQHWFVVSRKQALACVDERATILDFRSGVYPLARSFGERFGDDGVCQRAAIDVG
jgi:hypothetical protein